MTTTMRCPACGFAHMEPHRPLNAEVTFVAATGEIRYGNRVCTVQATQMDIFESLFDAYPQRVSFHALYKATYGEPLLAYDALGRTKLRQQIMLLRRALRNGKMRFDVASFWEHGNTARLSSYALQSDLVDNQQAAE